MAAIPDLGPKELLSPDQILHFLILSVSLVMAQQVEICTKLLYGLSSNNEPRPGPEERTHRLIE